MGTRSTLVSRRPADVEARDTSPDTLPWQELGAAARPSRRQQRLLRALIVASMACVAVDALVLLPAFLYPDAAGNEDWNRIVLLVGMIALAVLAWLQWRIYSDTSAALRQAARALRRGTWEEAVQGLRQPHPNAPSAFGDLANQVEGVMGESERRWRARVELSADWYWETDSRHRLSSMSAEAAIVKPAGRALGDLLGRRHDELGFLRPPERGFGWLHEQMDRHEALRELEFEVVGLGARERGWIALNGRPRFQRNGHFAGYEGTARDITEHKRAWQRLAASEQRWAVMAGLSADWYWQTDEHHRLPATPDAESLKRFGELATRGAGRTRWDAYAEALPPQAWAAHQAELHARRPFRGLEYSLQRADGSMLWVAVSGAPRFDSAGRFLGYQGVGRDITNRMRADLLLREHNRQLQQAVAARTRELQTANQDLEAFARQLAHELRTPLAQVVSLAELLAARATERLDDSEREWLALQGRAARNMLGTLEALLELARSTTEAIERREVDLSTLAREVIAALPAQARRAPVEWVVPQGVEVWASEPQLRIVLANLLGNAAKFSRDTEAPRVEIAVRDTDDGATCISVTDNGVGFEPEAAQRLFQPFSRLHSDRAFAGTGIGLSIVRRIVQRHGGTISARGEPGRGACVEFTLGRRRQNR